MHGQSEAAVVMPVPIGEPVPVPMRTRAGSAKATDVGTRHWCPLPRPARAAEAHPEVNHRPRAAGPPLEDSRHAGSEGPACVHRGYSRPGPVPSRHRPSADAMNHRP